MLNIFKFAKKEEDDTKEEILERLKKRYLDE